MSKKLKKLKKWTLSKINSNLQEVFRCQSSGEMNRIKLLTIKHDILKKIINSECDSINTLKGDLLNDINIAWKRKMHKRLSRYEYLEVSIAHNVLCEVIDKIDKLIKEPNFKKQKTNYDNIDLRQEPKKQKIKKHQIWECKATARYIEVNEIDKSVPNFKRIYYNYTGNEKQFNINTTGFYNKFRFIKDVKNEN